MAVGVNIISTFNAVGINKAIADFGRLKTSGQKAAFGLQTMNAGFAKLAKIGLVAGGVLAFAALKLAKAGEHAETANARLETIAKSMGLFGSEAEHVSTRLIKLAESQALLVGVDTNTIKLTEAKLLTFKQLAVTANEVGGNFDRATMAALDLAASGFGEASKNAAQLGKAMQDPIKGITALRRAGVTFTAEEREQIKVLVEAGKMLEAQDTVLKAIETQVGGTALATANATEKMKVGFSQMAEDIGGLLVPAVDALARFINGTLVPYIDHLAKVIDEEGLGAALRMVGGDLMDFITNMDAVGNTILAIVAIFYAVKLATIAYTTTVAILSVILPLLQTSLVATTVAQTQLNVAMIANPIGLVIAAIVAFIVILVALYVKFEVVRKVMNTVFNFLIRVLENFVNAWIGVFNIIIIGINAMIRVNNFFGGNMETIGHIGEVSFGRIGDAADAAIVPLGGVTEALRQFRIQEHMLGDQSTKSLHALTSVALATAEIATSQAEVNALRELAMSGEMIDPEELSDALDALSKAEKVLKDIKGTSAAGGGTSKKIETATEKLKKYIDALKGSTAAERSLRDSTKSLADARTAQIASVQKVTDAQARFNLVTRGYAANSKEAKDATERMTAANKRLRDANISQQDAIRSVTDAEKKLQALRAIKANPADVAEAERNLEKSKYAVEGSVFAVADAERELAALRADPLSSPTDIRKAEIALAEAKLGVTEATVAQQDAEAKLTAERDKAATPEEIADAERDLETAKLAVIDAIDNTTEAIDNQTAAQAYLNEILHGAAEGSDAYRDALKDLQDAQREETDAIDAVTAAIEHQADAIDALREAEEKLREVRGTTGKKIRAKGDAAVAHSFAAASALPTSAVGSIATQIDDIFKGLDFNWNGLMMASGGVVNKPTLAMIGEKGSEAVIPLDQIGMMGSTNVYLTVNAGMGTDGVAVGDQIVNALARWNRRNGSLPLKVM